MLDSITFANEPNANQQVYPLFSKNCKDIFTQAKRQLISEQREKEKERESRRRNTMSINRPFKYNLNKSINTSVIKEVNELNDSLASLNDSCTLLLNDNKSLVDNWINISQTLIKLSTPKVNKSNANALTNAHIRRNQLKSWTIQERHCLTLSSTLSDKNQIKSIRLKAPITINISH